MKTNTLNDNFVTDHAEKGINSLLEIITESNIRIGKALEDFKKSDKKAELTLDINKSGRLIVNASNTLKQLLKFS